MPNKAEFIELLAERLDGDKKRAAHALDAVIDTVYANVAKGERVALTGFGIFEKRDRAARIARNPATGATVQVKKTVRSCVPPGRGVQGDHERRQEAWPRRRPRPRRRRASRAKKAAAAKKAPARRRPPRQEGRRREEGRGQQGTGQEGRCEEGIRAQGCAASRIVRVEGSRRAMSAGAVRRTWSVQASTGDVVVVGRHGRNPRGVGERRAPRRRPCASSPKSVSARAADVETSPGIGSALTRHDHA